MDGFTAIWNQILVWPIEWALLSLTELTTSAALAIILFTFIVRTLMLPLGLKQIHSMKAMAGLQPQMKDLQQRYAGDRSRLAQEQMRLYKESGVNPAAGCLPMLIQMPIWIALYSALINLSSPDRNIAAFHAPFLWISNLGQVPFINPGDVTTWVQAILPILTGVTQWVVQKMSTLPTADPQQQQMQRMMEFMPIMFVFFSFQVASGLTLYWVVSNFYSFFQQLFTTGWGTLPFLGSTGAIGGGGPPPGSDRPPHHPRPKRPRSSGRRKRGK